MRLSTCPKKKKPAEEPQGRVWGWISKDVSWRRWVRWVQVGIPGFHSVVTYYLSDGMPSTSW